MRTDIISNGTLKGKAYSGTYVVVLAWDFESSDKQFRKSLLGFGIERAELHGNSIVEKYSMKGIKRFKDKDKGLAPGTPVSTFEHPIQSFQWCDYTAKENVKYIYKIVPIYGQPKNLDIKYDLSISISIDTEPVIGKNFENLQQHDIYFNRGVIGSQAYAREFGNVKPDSDDPESKEMKWLSRGLYEALIDFISLAKNEKYALRAALYEFHYLPVAIAFAKIIEAGADVKIVYDAESSYKIENQNTIKRAGLDLGGVTIPRTVTEGIRHNKFIVLLENEVPIAVWTGSTNISAGGIFGHSNVGHVVWDKDVALQYFEYWNRLAQNLTPSIIRPLNKEATPTPTTLPAKNSIISLFSPRDGKDENTTLEWYAKLMNSAKKIMCITLAFNLDEVFQSVIKKDNDVLRYIVKDDNLGTGEDIGTDKDVIFASGGYFGKDSLFNFLQERDNPLNSNDYIHNKFMLIDPLSMDPIVITGSANFSRPSQRSNDENMLVIRGNTRVADIYFGEFMRIFDHHYARYINRILSQQNINDPNAGYLKINESWTESHFDTDSYKSKRRKYFLNSETSI
ncbi:MULTISPECIES: phospholipase D-like domain-containing protein [Emticicia]|uniref:phospholipase D-like domain-containing protein n=1 Tax=Emticicia TaxID=312278 RepID=UPI0007D8B32A|nr:MULTISPECIES: phospholipase D-like domain-containing protein [Emticicia]